MSAPSSSGDAWSARLEPSRPPELPHRPDDPRLGETAAFWGGGEPSLQAGRPVLIGFPHDEGVRRNKGRPGAAAAPDCIRSWLYRLVSASGAWEVDLASLGLLDVGNIRKEGSLEEAQQALGEVVGAVLRCQAIPIVLGGGHETAYGHFLGYVQAGLPVGIINIDAHLDVRPPVEGQGHSGSPFRQAMEHPTRPLGRGRYACLGLQPASVSREHLALVRSQEGVVAWAGEVEGQLAQYLQTECERMRGQGCRVYVSLDSDVAWCAEVPGVSAPNPLGLSGKELAACAYRAGSLPEVASFDLVEINPQHDRDGQSARWAAQVVWHFLAGLAARPAASTRCT